MIFFQINKFNTPGTAEKMLKIKVKIKKIFDVFHKTETALKNLFIKFTPIYIPIIKCEKERKSHFTCLSSHFSSAA